MLRSKNQTGPYTIVYTGIFCSRSRPRSQSDSCISLLLKFFRNCVCRDQPFSGGLQFTARVTVRRRKNTSLFGKPAALPAARQSVVQNPVEPCRHSFFVFWPLCRFRMAEHNFAFDVYLGIQKHLDGKIHLKYRKRMQIGLVRRFRNG